MMHNVVNGLLVATIMLIAVATCLDLSHSSGDDATTAARPLDVVKNLEHLDQHVLPDITHLADKFRDKAKYGHLVAMLDVWKATLLADERFQVSKSE